METQMKLEHKIELRWLILFALPTFFLTSLEIYILSLQSFLTAS